MGLYNMIGVVTAGVVTMLFAVSDRRKNPRRRHWESTNIFMRRRRNISSAPAG